MNKETQPRQMFPDSRILLGIFSPVLAVFFFAGVYFTNDWQPSNIGDKALKYLAQDALFTFITLCGVGFIASVVGPHRIQPMIARLGGKAAKAGLALITGSIIYLLYCLAKM
jgi:hypothetical protein